MPFLQSEASTITSGITCRGLKVSVENVLLVEGDVHVAPGEIAVLTGANGSGKTTMLKTMIGLHRSASETRFGGIGLSALRNPLQQIGFLIERGDNHPRRSIRDHLRMHTVLAGLAEPDKAVEHALNRFNLLDVAHMAPPFVSTGQQQRLRIAQVFLTDPLFVLLDEPMIGLDEDSIVLLGEALKHVSQQGGAVLVATHNPDQFASTRHYHIKDKTLLNIRSI